MQRKHQNCYKQNKLELIQIKALLCIIPIKKFLLFESPEMFKIDFLYCSINLIMV
jgi:hypothetical protein